MRVSGCPWAGEYGHGSFSPKTCGILHRTYGQWAGDVSTVENGGLAHFVVGQDEGQWLQMADTDSITYNVGNWDANQHSVAIEFTGVNEDPLTDWQVRSGGEIIRQVSSVYGFPLTHDDGSNGPNDTAPWSGWYSHRAVAPDQGSQHTDFVSSTDWSRMTGSGGITGTGDAPSQIKEIDMIIVETTDGKWHLVNSDGGRADCDPAVAYVLGLSGVPVLRNQNPLALIGICMTIGKAAKDAKVLATKLG